MLSITPDGFEFYFATLTLQNNPRVNITLDTYKKARKRIVEKLSRYYIDVVAKTEFHKSGIPHLHLILILQGDDNRIYEKIIKYNPNIKINEDENKIDLLRNLVRELWIDCINLYMCNFDNPLNIAHYIAHVSACTNIESIKDYKKAVYYISRYTTKDKEYQNEIPIRFVGLRFTSKSFRNFGKKLFSEKIVVYKISDRLFDLLRLETQENIILENPSYKRSVLNGFFYRNWEKLARFCADSCASSGDVFTIKDDFGEIGVMV